MISPGTSFTEGRGAVRIDSRSFWPSAHFDSADTLLSKRMWKFICRMSEIERRPMGHLALKTWTLASASLVELPTELAQVLKPMLQASPSIAGAVKLKEVVDRAFLELQTNIKQERIRAWKSKLQQSSRAQHAWLRQGSISSSLSCFSGTNGQPTCNVNEQFQAVRRAWKSATELFRNGEPNHEDFFSEYGQFIHPHPVTFRLLLAMR